MPNTPLISLWKKKRLYCKTKMMKTNGNEANITNIIENNMFFFLIHTLPKDYDS